MAVQPTTNMTDDMMGLVQSGDGMVIETTEQNAMVEVFSPSAAALNNAMREAIDHAPAGAHSLADAAVTLNELGSQWPHHDAFDPTSALDISFNPNDGDAWDAQDVAATTVAELSFDEFFNFA